MESFQTSNLSAQGPKNYVFVDEHNRHKRLKVMRACEGCRRRKIKCDAATTNSWPCAACKRLKLTCVPPVGGVDGEANSFEAGDANVADHQIDHSGQQYPADHFHYMRDYGSQPDLSHQFPATYDQGMYNVVQTTYPFTNIGHNGSMAPTGVQQHEYPQHRYPSFDSANGAMPGQSVGSPQSVDSVTAEELAENLGDLRIEDNGIAPYIRQQPKTQDEAPAPLLDDEEDLPALETTAGSQVRIPPALMPSDEDALQAFQDYFRDVHPYVPVLCKSQFYHNWQHDRHSISPLLLETVLACAGQVSGDPAGGSQWLALANRHEQNFADTPRLSTVQALLILLKAREKIPKRGYYYRSWILVKKIVGMAKDLDLHEHHELHSSGGVCDASPTDCLSKTRTWQVAMVVELMVGGPQGRSDYGVDIDTVDTSTNPPNSDLDEYEKKLSREFAYWVRNVRNIRGVTETYHKLKRKNQDWANDPKFYAWNDQFKNWPEQLPNDLRLTLPGDRLPPTVPSHFIANMHCHFQLGIVMLYKPQLTASKDFSTDEKWKFIMGLCYSSAKQVCLYQEAALKQYGVVGLACMQRGLSFPIYAILSCVMVHLIAITSPEPKFNQDAREYFTRHMQILEACIKEWPMPEVEAQIRGLRAAFSADLSRPFALRPSFPYGTPSEQSRSPDAPRTGELQSMSAANNDAMYNHHMSATSNAYFPTPPVSAGANTKPNTPHYYGEYGGNESGHTVPHAAGPSNPHNGLSSVDQWNPTPIIDQFNTAFAIPASALAPPPTSSYSSSPPIVMPQQGFQTQIPPHYIPSPTSAGGYNPNPYAASPTSHTMQPPGNYMPPNSQAMQPGQLTPSHFPIQTSGNSYFDGQNNMNTSPHGQLAGGEAFMQAQKPPTSAATQDVRLRSPVYVTPREWQQSVASVFDPNGLKRKWTYDGDMMQHSGRPGARYGGAG